MSRVAIPSDELRKRALKYPDTWWTVLVIDPIALRILPLLLRAPRITPMSITVVGSCIGAGSVAAFFSGHLAVAAVLYEVRFLCDCLDGKLARLRRLASTRGAFLDLFSDVLLITAAMAGLAWHLAPHARGGSGVDQVPLALSSSCVFACFVLFWLILWDLDHPRATGSRGADRTTWLYRRRLHRLPRTVEIETLLLFLAPLTGSQLVLRISFAIALTYFVLAAAKLSVRLYRTSPGPPRDSTPDPATTLS